MGVPGNANALLLRSAAAAGGYQVSRSLRFNPDDSPSLTRTPGSAGNRKTFTWSGWVKRSAISSRYTLFAAGSSGSAETEFFFEQSTGANTLHFYHYPGSYQGNCRTIAVFRDTSAWYHIVLVVDTTQATASNRCKIYVNGVQQDTTFATNFTQNADLYINSTVSHGIGYSPTNSFHFSGYLADIWFLDGIAATPSDFAETDATTGQWIPKAYTLAANPNSGITWNSTYAAAFQGNAMTDSALVGSFTGLNGSITITLSSSVTVTSSLRLNLYANVANFGTYTTVSINGTNQTANMTLVQSTGTNSGVWQVTGFTGTLSSITLGAQNVANNGISRVIVDGTTLLNGAGNNTFQLKFADNSAATATTLGKDTSGNSPANNWTPTNFSVTAGAGNDSLVDTPTSYGTDDSLGGSVRGNYATLNPLAGNTIHTVSNGNLTLTATNSNWSRKISTIGMSSGKWYAEFTFTTAGNNTNQVGVISFLPPVNANNQNGEETGQSMYNGYNGDDWNGTIFNNGSRVSTGNTIASSGDVIGVALDASANNVKYYRNGTLVGSSSGYTPTNVSGTWYFVTQCLGSGVVDCNYGQRAWAYTPPANYQPLVDTLLPSPSVAKPSTVMDVKLYSGTSSNQTISGLNLSPDMVWIKERNGTSWHRIMDIVRGAGKEIFTNATNAEASYSQGLNSFTSDGFTLGTGSDSNVNTSGYTYAAWCWDAGTSTVTNTQGSITSQVRANASAGFSIVTWTGTGSLATIGHGLGVAPSFIVIKRRNAATDWDSYHASLGNTQGIALNSTAAASTGSGYWNNTSPTSTVFTVNTGVQANGGTYVAYCFAPVAGYSSFGSYVGNNNPNGPFVYTGFRPRFILIKNISEVKNWLIYDTARDPYNVGQSYLAPNLSNAEATITTSVDILSNGFKLRYDDGSFNGTGTQIYAAFAESPFQFSRAR